MDTRAEPADRGPIGADPPAVSSSDRLQLEVALLAEAVEPPLLPLPAEGDGDAATRSVLVVTREPDLCAYIGDCLRGGEGLRVLEAGAGESTLDALRRLRPQLLIAEPSALPGDGRAGRSLAVPDEPALAPVPLLLIAEEVPEDWQVWQTRQQAPVAFLLTPFNARRLVQEVDRLLAADPLRPAGTRLEGRLS